MASGGRAPRSRTTRVAARRSSAGSTASRYGRPPRSGVVVQASKRVIAFRSGALTFVGGIGPRPLLTRTAIVISALAPSVRVAEEAGERLASIEAERAT